jgi:RNA polymerase sigma factor (TIGR02999 family)
MQEQPTESSADITRLLDAVRAGDRSALDSLVPLLYDELRRIARRELRRERVQSTLQPTGLVHEVYIKLAAGSGIQASDRPHFMAIAARAMRQVLVDHARRRRSHKRGGDWAVTTLTDNAQIVELRADEMISLDRALEELDERQRQVVECRFFAGLQEEETAAALGVSVRTVRRDWIRARAWLYRELYPSETATSQGVAPPLDGAPSSNP